nr:restriction endonuclease subunit S [Paenibacillus apiarius]
MKDVILIDKNIISPGDINDQQIYIGLEDIEKENGNINEKYVRESNIKSNKFIFTEEHILYGKLRPNLNKVCLPEFKGICSTDIYPILVKRNRAEKAYIFHILHSQEFVKYASNRTSGANLPRVNEKVIYEYEISLPPLETQKQIAKTLNIAAVLLAMRKQQLAELDNLIKSIFYEMFGENNIYIEKSLIELIVEGAGLSYGIVQPGEDIGKGIGILRPIDINHGTISMTNIKRIPPDVEEPYKKTRLNGNEILITVRGTTGETALTDQKHMGMNVTRGIAVIRQNNSLINRIFLNEYLKSGIGQRFIRENTKGATLKQINLSVLREMRISLPPLPLQKQFAARVTKIEEQKALVQKAIDETQYLFDSLMSEYFE